MDLTSISDSQLSQLSLAIITESRRRDLDNKRRREDLISERILYSKLPEADSYMHGYETGVLWPARWNYTPGGPFVWGTTASEKAESESLRQQWLEGWRSGRQCQDRLHLVVTDNLLPLRELVESSLCRSRLRLTSNVGNISGQDIIVGSRVRIVESENEVEGLGVKNDIGRLGSVIHTIMLYDIGKKFYLVKLEDGPLEMVYACPNNLVVICERK